MSLRAPKDTVESLRLMLQRLEQNTDPSGDPADRAELKRIFMLRIANLEALEVLKTEALKSAPKESPRSGASDGLPQPLPPDRIAPPAPDANPAAAPPEQPRD